MRKKVRSFITKATDHFYNLTIYLIIYIHTFFSKCIYLSAGKTKPLTRKNKFLNMRTADKLFPLSYLRVRELRLITASFSTLDRTVSIISAISSIRSSLAPRVVMAGVPKRIPEVWNAERLSNGTIFLFTVISADTNAFSATLPVRSGIFATQVDQHR